MAEKFFAKHKTTPLTDDEVKVRYEETKEELEEVLKWEKEEKEKLKDPKATPQKIAAAKRALKKASWRVDTVKGQILYWKMRVKGESHFKANLEKNEYWAECKEKKLKAT